MYLHPGKQRLWWPYKFDITRIRRCRIIQIIQIKFVLFFAETPVVVMHLRQEVNPTSTNAKQIPEQCGVIQSTLGFATMGKAANLALATRNAVTDLF